MSMSMVGQIRVIIGEYSLRYGRDPVDVELPPWAYWTICSEMPIKVSSGGTAPTQIYGVSIHIQFNSPYAVVRSSLLSRLDDELYLLTIPNLIYSVPPHSTHSGECEHDWKDYQGFTDSFKYCSKCDEKNKQS